MKIAIIDLSTHRYFQIAIVILSFLALGLALILERVGISWSHYPLIFIIILGGIPAVLSIAVDLLKGNMGADALAAIAIITAVILQEDYAATLVILMLASGQALESYAMKKASSTLMALAKRMPNLVHRRKQNHIEDIALEDIAIGDEIVVYPHETCPVDGEVIEGQGSMDESYLTGEPYQISKAKGATVLSGAINGETALVLKAEKLAADSRYATIVNVLKEAEQKRPTIKRVGDQIGAIFTPLTLLIAFFTWYLSHDALRLLAVLVIATPCPLLIAIPVGLISAISIAAKHAIIIKNPSVLEQLPICRTAIFDKTGTLTYGKPQLTNIVVAKNDYHWQAIDVLQRLASLERYSKHPLANAILKAAKQHQLPLLAVDHISEKAGEGLQGIIEKHHFVITSRKKLLAKNKELIHQLPPSYSGLECVVTCNDHYIATLHFHDAPRKDSKSFINHLAPQHQFNKLMLVSGDRRSEVEYFGSLLHFSEIYDSRTPEQKLDIVVSERKKAPTLFLGDGINDAPALKAATVGIAFGHGNVVSEAADAVIMENTLQKVDELMHLSIDTRTIILQSAVGGMLLSVIGMLFAAFGFIPPVLGALLQELIDVLAILNSLRLIWNKKIETDFT